MITDITVLYGARVVHPGKRREEQVLLATVTPVRIPDLSPSAGRALTIRFDFLDQAVSRQRIGLSWLESMRQDPQPWLGEDGQLYAPKRVAIGKAMSRPLTIDEVSGLTATMASLGNTMGLRPEAREAELLQTARAMSDQTYFSSGNLPVLPEGTAFRSSTPVVPGARDIAIAHALSRARRWRCDPLTREVFVPSQGPVLEVRKERIDLRFEPHGTESVNDQVRFRADQSEEALAFQQAVHGAASPLDRYSVLVERPGEYAQDWTAWNTLAFAAGVFGRTMANAERNGPHQGMEEALALKARFHAIAADVDQHAPPPGVLDETMSILHRMGELAGPRSWLTGRCQIEAEPIRRFVDYQAMALQHLPHPSPVGRG